MRLNAWGTVWIEYELDGRDGDFSRRFVRRSDQIRSVSGQASLERTPEHGRILFCIYLWEGDIFFRAGVRRWNLSRPDLRLAFSVLDRNRSEFRVFEGAQETFRCSYTHRLRGLLARIDPTYDGLDFLNDHFLSHVASLSLPATLAAAPGWQRWIDGARATEADGER